MFRHFGRSTLDALHNRPLVQVKESNHNRKVPKVLAAIRNRHVAAAFHGFFFLHEAPTRDLGDVPTADVGKLVGSLKVAPTTPRS